MQPNYGIINLRVIFIETDLSGPVIFNSEISSLMAWRVANIYSITFIALLYYLNGIILKI